MRKVICTEDRKCYLENIPKMDNQTGGDMSGFNLIPLVGSSGRISKRRPTIRIRQVGFGRRRVSSKPRRKRQEANIKKTPKLYTKKNEI